jgi:hypothetical protein
MGQINRIMFGFFTTVGMAMVAAIYIRAGLPLLARLEASDGPLSSVAPEARIVIPLAIILIEVSTLVYVIFGSVEEEKKVVGP